MKSFLVVALLFAACGVLAQEEAFGVELVKSVDATSSIEASSIESDTNKLTKSAVSEPTKKELEVIKKAAQALGPAYLAINQALGPRTQAYVNNYLQALGYAPFIGFMRNLYASSGRQQFISFIRQYSALYGGASGYQLATYVRNFGSPAAAAQEFAAFYKSIGVPLLVFLQQFTVTTGGRASARPAQMTYAIFKANGEADSIDALEAMLSALGNKPKVLGALIGRLYNNLNAASLTELIANQLAGVVSVVEAAADASAIPAFDFTSLDADSFDVTAAATIIVAAIKANNYF
jgi:hypothetical protein